MNKTKQLAVLILSVFILVSTLSTACAKADTPVIAEGKKVSLEYTLTLKEEGVIDSNVGKDPMVFVYGTQQVIPGLEKGVAGLKVGDTKMVEIAPEDAYGPVFQEAITSANINQFPDELKKVGALVQTEQNGQSYRGKVISIEGETVKVDFNHPLAGKTLFFDIKVLGIE